MDNFTAVNIIEFIENGDVVEAYQHLIDNGVVWQLQGSYGRNAAMMIEEGLCHPALIREGVCHDAK